MIRLLLSLLLCVCSASAEIIKPARRIDWYGNVGVPGGIPANRTTVYQNFSPGATAAQINTAIADCPANQVVYLNAGTYTIGTLNLAKNNDVTLRGAGPGVTIIQTTGGSTAISADEYGFAGAAAISSGYTKGSTAITMSSAPSANFVVGTCMSLDQDDESGLVFNRMTDGRHIRFIVRITNVAGSVISFSPALPYGFTAGLNPKASYANGGDGLTGFGIESLSIVGNGTATGLIYLVGAQGCWFKDLDISEMEDTALWLIGCFRCEVRRCVFRDAPDYPDNPDGYGVYLYEGSSFCLVEDNAADRLFVGFSQNQSSANVFIYNVARDGGALSFGHQIGIINVQHGPHGMFTLWEGNTCEQFVNDGSHGSGSHQTLFRNWFHGISANATTNRKMIDLCRGSLYHNAVGNVLGSATWKDDANVQYQMTGQPGYGDQAVMYRLGYPNQQNNGLEEDDIQEPFKDIPDDSYPHAAVAATLLRHGNYDYANEAQVWETDNTNAEDYTDHAIPNSLYYSEKPAYFRSLAWPPFSPASPGSASIANLPAGYRLTHAGADPPADGGGGGSGTSSGGKATFGGKGARL